MDESTKREIRRIADWTLREAGLTTPPVSVERLLEHVQLYRDYYDLSDPGFLERTKHKLLIHGRRLVDVIRKVQLRAVLLFDEGRICLDRELPKIKHPWASCHEVGHRILSWHQPYFYGDTAQTLDPAWHEALEAEANYAAARLLFCGDAFACEACDSAPSLAGLKALAKRYHTSLTTTLRRYVEEGPDYAMVMLVSTPAWKTQPVDQEQRTRYFVPSTRFTALFPDMMGESLRVVVDEHAKQQRGGLVADFGFALMDARGQSHELSAWTFHNQHYLLTLIVETRTMHRRTILMSKASAVRSKESLL